MNNTTADANTQKLYDRDASVEFYEQRYKDGYMVDWPEEKKQHITEVVKGLNLPPVGVALDFGCGNGILTEIVRQALPPAWTVYGTDLSLQAVSNAREGFPRCKFFAASDAPQHKGTVDLIFSNHVIEHVYDLEEVFDEMNRYLKPGAGMLHFLPCGNPGSFEHSLCMLRTDGFNPALGNRFFYEDEGHVRRLSTTDFENIAAKRGFTLAKEFYTNHRDGAVNWITNSVLGLVWRMTSGASAVDASAKLTLLRWRLWLMSLTIARLPARVVQIVSAKPKKKPVHHVLRALALPAYPFSKAIDTRLKRRAAEEWETRKNKRGGSEMALYFSRKG